MATLQRLQEALSELNNLSHVNLDEYSDSEYEYRGELIGELFEEFARAGYRPVYVNGQWKAEKKEQ